MKKHLVLLSALLLQAAAVSVFAQDKVEPEYVDLGLSVKWATCNVGAATPFETGYTYRWDNNGKWIVFYGETGDLSELEGYDDYDSSSNNNIQNDRNLATSCEDGYA